MNTIKARNRILSLAQAICLLLTMVLYLPGPVEVRAADVDIGTADDISVDIAGGTLVYFGHNHMQNANNLGVNTGYADSNRAPIAWRVVYDNGDDTLTLLSDQLLATRPYDSTNDHNSWSGSEIATYLNGDFLTESFDSREVTAMEEHYSLDEEEGYQPTDKFTPDQMIVLPSVAEVDGSWFSNNSEREAYNLSGFRDYWWLRSPGDTSINAAVVDVYGNVFPDHEPNGNGVTKYYGIRPAFRLDLSSVIFTSDASGASPKSDATVGSTLSSAAKPQSGAVKLTILDSTLDLTSVTPQDVDGRTVAFDYTGATSGKTLSAIVTAADGTVSYYGQLEASTSALGNGIEVTVPEDFAASDSLQIFVEELHGDYETDYAGTPVTLAIEEKPAPTTPQGVGETATGNDGKITGVNDTMEYRKVGDTAWMAVATNNTEIIGLASDDYEVRVAGKVESGAAHLASPAKTVTVGGYLAPSLTMLPEKTTLTVSEEVNGETVATADAQNFSGDPVIFSIDGTPTLPAGLDIDPGEGRIYVDDASLLVATPTTIVTVKADDSTESATDTVTITIRESVGPDPGPTANPSAIIDNSTLQVDDTATLRISLGQSGGAPMATGANIAVDDKEVVSVNRNSLDADGDVTVTATGVGETDIHITFEGVSGHDETIHVKVSDSGTTPPVNPPTTSSGGRSSSRSGGSSTPDGQRAKTTLPANAFTWDGRTLTIDHDSVTPLGLQSVRWDNVPLTRGTDFAVYSGSVIIRFSEDFMEAQSPGEHTIKVEFLNHTGEATVKVGDTGGSGDDNNHNPDTGGYPDGSYPATDNPNTGDGRGIWPALLLGSLGGIVLVVRRLKPVA